MVSMGIKRKKKNRIGINLTSKKLEILLTEFFTQHEADMSADYKPSSEQWRQLLAQEVTRFIIANTR
jgi:lysophospholipase L1-like esterase